jgi:hypothetical protein
MSESPEERLLRHYAFARRMREADPGHMGERAAWRARRLVQTPAKAALALAKDRIAAADIFAARHPEVAADYDRT